MSDGHGCEGITDAYVNAAEAGFEENDGPGVGEKNLENLITLWSLNKILQFQIFVIQ